MDYRAIDLSDIKGYSPFLLASMAELNAPDRRESYGAIALSELRDETVQAWEEGRFEHDSDRLDREVCEELAENTLTSESHPVFSAWVDLAVWAEGWPDTSEYIEPGVHSFAGTIEDMVRTMLHEALARMAMAVVADIRKALADWVCPACGDTGEPRLCWPGEPCSEAEETDQAPEVPVGIYPALSVDTQAAPVTDPLLTLIGQVEAERARELAAQDPSATQGFMRRMEEINAEEFAAQRFRDRVIGWGGLAAIVLVALGVLVMVMAR